MTTIEVELRLYALTLSGAALGARNSKHTFMRSREGLFDLQSGFFHPAHNSWYHKIDKDKVTDHHYVSGKLPTYPSPKPTLTLTSHLGQNVGLGEG